MVAFVVHLLTDLGMTEESMWHRAAVVLEMTLQLQPLVTVLIFSRMFPRFYKMLLCK